MENRVDILDIFIDFYNNKIFLRMEGIYIIIIDFGFSILYLNLVFFFVFKKSSYFVYI